MVLSALAVVAASLGLAAAFWATDSVLFGTAGFQVVVLVAAVLGVLAGLGLFNQGFGLALACVAGTIFVGTGFSYLDAHVNLASVAGVAPFVTPVAIVSAALAAALGCCGSIDVLGRNPRSWPLVARAVVIGVPVAAVTAYLVLTRGGALAQSASGLMEVIRIMAILVGGLVLAVLFSVAGHLVIRAFELGATDPDGQIEPSD